MNIIPMAICHRILPLSLHLRPSIYSHEHTVILSFCPNSIAPPVEIGAEFIHGSENNVLVEWMKKNGVKGRPEAGTMVRFRV